MFATYFDIGYRHIVSLAGFDHLLFIIVLCAVYHRNQWRRILALLTGFTLGHSLTLALTALHLVAFPQRVIETLIPFTILATSVANVVISNNNLGWRPFAIAGIFGLIHGCGFAGYFTMMLGEEQSIVGPLFAFNVGLEAGQVVVVAVFYGLFAILERLQPIVQRDWALFVSGGGAALSIKMILDYWNA
ncbi:MAG: HupE/UreJ family protein [Saprospiraceae bacterium]|nr:HupE/UreJ family protein [Saprospiraceae bacterium]